MRSGRFAALALLALLSSCGEAPTAGIRAPDAPLLNTVSVQLSCPFMLSVGSSGFCSAQGYDSNGNPTATVASFNSSNPSSVSVSGSGVVTALAPSGATITAWIGPVSGSTYVSVPTPSVLTTVTVTPTPTTVNRYHTRQLTARGYDQNGTQMNGLSFTWSSSNTAVATVNASGQVYGVSTGTATITATSGGKSGSASLTVTVPALSVGLSGPSSTPRNQSVQYTASVMGGTPPYTYQWRKRYGNFSFWNAWESWYGTGTTNSTSASVTYCGIHRGEVEVRVTDSQGATGGTSYTFFVTNPC